MATNQDEDSEPTQAYDLDQNNAIYNDHQKGDTKSLNEYYVIEGPEKQWDDETDNSEPTNGVSNRPDRWKNTKELQNQIKCGREEMVASTSHVKGHQKSLRDISPQRKIAAVPQVNCKEKIIICLDLSEEMNSTSFRSRAGDKYSGLDVAIRAVKMFVLHKSQMNSAHEFAFMIFTHEPTVIQGFSSRPQDLLNTLEETEMLTQECGPLDLSKLFNAIQENVELPNVPDNARVIPPPFIVRLFVIFGRSQSIPIELGKEAQKALEASPYFFTDVLYIHDPPSDENKCEEIFNTLCGLDHTGLSYILEASKYTPVFTSGAKLLAHPLQRPLQEQAAYKIGSYPVVQIIDERCI